MIVRECRYVQMGNLELKSLNCVLSRALLFLQLDCLENRVVPYHGSRGSTFCRTKLVQGTVFRGAVICAVTSVMNAIIY